jgi:hypothetical protein
VTHYDVSREGIEIAVRAMAEVVESARAKPRAAAKWTAFAED